MECKSSLKGHHCSLGSPCLMSSTLLVPTMHFYCCQGRRSERRDSLASMASALSERTTSRGSLTSNRMSGTFAEIAAASGAALQPVRALPAAAFSACFTTATSLTVNRCDLLR